MTKGTHVTFRDLYGRTREGDVESTRTDHNGREMILVHVEGANHNPWHVSPAQIITSAAPVTSGYDETGKWHAGRPTLHDSSRGPVVLCPLGHLVSGVGDYELSKNAHAGGSWSVKCYGKTEA